MKKKRIGCLPVLMIFSLIVIIAIGFIYYKDGKTYSDLETEVTYQKKEKYIIIDYVSFISRIIQAFCF